jgi:hypothetical protein
MKKCPSCGERKPDSVATCPSCQAIDHDAIAKTTGGTPSLTLLIAALVLFWAFRFCRIGLAAWSGNLRLAAILAFALGLAAMVFGAMWTFGIRSRKQGALVAIIALAVYVLLQFV